MNAKRNQHHTAMLAVSDTRKSRSLRTVETDDRQLHVCPDCDSPAVQPHDWIEHPTNWQMTLECPNCGWLESGTFSIAAVERYEDHLEAGARELTADLRELTSTTMLAELDQFAAGLAFDLIRPEDF